MNVDLNVCGCDFCGVFSCYFLGSIMENSTQDLFSLEDDDFNKLFIMQSSSNVGNFNDQNDVEVDNTMVKSQFGIVETDFQSPCMSIVQGIKGNDPIYEDISQDEFQPNDKMEVDNTW